jgi:hypothetical protein
MNSGAANRIAVSRIRDVVDVTSEDSFPASDPPSWTPIVGTGPPCRIGRRAGVDTRTARDQTPVPAHAVPHTTDYPDASRCALHIACRLAAGGRVTLLHVQEPPHMPSGVGATPAAAVRLPGGVGKPVRARSIPGGHRAAVAFSTRTVGGPGQ